MLLSLYDLPGKHCKNIHTTNPIENSFATVQLRTLKTKTCLNCKTALAMTFKLNLNAQR